MKPLLTKIIRLTTILAIVAIQSKAQETIPQSGITNSETVVPEAVQNLMQFVGRWEAEITMNKDGKEYKLNYWVESKKEADGFALYADEGFTHPELGTMRGANLVGWDPYDAKIKWFSVDNMGTTHEHLGGWITPYHLQITNNGMHEGKSFVETIDFIFKPDAILFQMSETLDGMETTKADGIFSKKTVKEAAQKKAATAPAKKPVPVKKK